MNGGAKPILISVAGGIFIYSGIKGLTLSATIRSLVSGENPAKLAATYDQYNIDPNSPEGQALADGTAPPPGVINRAAGDPHPTAHGRNVIGPVAIYRYARQAGFSRSAAIIATAVALAESGGNTKAHCLNCVPGVTEDSRGLWQINVDAHPQFAQGNLYDPGVNAAAAYAVSNGGRNFNPWSTYTNGAYKSHLTQAMRAAG